MSPRRANRTVVGKQLCLVKQTLASKNREISFFVGSLSTQIQSLDYVWRPRGSTRCTNHQDPMPTDPRDARRVHAAPSTVLSRQHTVRLLHTRTLSLHGTQIKITQHKSALRMGRCSLLRRRCCWSHGGKPATHMCPCVPASVCPPKMRRRLQTSRTTFACMRP